jgi:MFS family permease
MDAFLSLGRILGPLLGGWLYEKGAYPYSVLAGILVIATLCLYIPLRRIESEVASVS